MINQQTRNTRHAINMNTVDSRQQEVPGPSEQNNQKPYDELGRGARNAIFASKHKSDPQWRDRRVRRNVIFIVSTGLAMIVAATFATILELSDLWQNLWLAICISFALLFLVGVIRFGSELSLKSWRTEGFIRGAGEPRPRSASSP